MNGYALTGLVDLLAAPLARAAILSLIAGGFCVALLGLTLMIWPRHVERWSRRMNRWYSTQRALRVLEIPHYWERFFYRHARVFGALILTGSLFVLGWLALAPAPPNAIAGGDDAVAAWLLDAFTLFVMLGNLGALVFAVVLLVRPSALKALEQRANQWISTNRLLRFLDEPYPGPERLVFRYPRFSGGVMVVTGLYLALTLLYFVAH